HRPRHPRQPDRELGDRREQGSTKAKATSESLHRRTVGCHADTSGCVAEYGPAGIKQRASSSDISTMPSSLILMCRPEKVCTAPVPCGALMRTFTGLGGFRFSGSLWCFSRSASLWYISKMF